MKKIVLSFVVISITLITSCGGGENSNSENENQNNGLNSKNSNCLDFAITEKYQSLDPIKVTDVTSYHIVGQIYESLIRFDDKDLSLQPLLAESWTVDEKNILYTITLKKGVHFHDNACFKNEKGREIKASDIIYTFKRIYSNETGNYAYTLFKNKIKGSEEYRSSSEGEISGIEAIDDYTIQFTLLKPSPNFLSLLATASAAIVSHEAIESNSIVGSGPFTYSKENDTETAITLLKNENYHVSDKKGNKLPYLSSVAYNYVSSGQDKLALFMDNKLDVITGIPSESIKDIVESQIADFQDKPVKYVLGRYPQISTSYLSLNTAIEPFNNIKIRKAIAMAINKTKIVDDVLNGEAYGPGNHGMVPPAIKNYDFSSIVGLEYNISKAKQLLSDAGYPNGKGFPTLLLATGKSNTRLRAGLEIQKQLLANLNINVEISSLTLAEIMDLSSRSEINFSLRGWLGEIPDPTIFMSLFYGKSVPPTTDQSSYPNESRYKNKTFDKLYEEAVITVDTKKRYELCLTADQLIATEVPAIPLWYRENYQLIQSVVKDYQPNSMNLQYLTYVKLVNDPVKKNQ